MANYSQGFVGKRWLYMKECHVVFVTEQRNIISGWGMFVSCINP